jgi:hypothetical protein
LRDEVARQSRAKTTKLHQSRGGRPFIRARYDEDRTKVDTSFSFQKREGGARIFLILLLLLSIIIMLSSSLLLRRSAATLASRGTGTNGGAAAVNSSFFDAARRWKSDDAGDVIGIDLGTTNSCVAIMVRTNLY